MSKNQLVESFYSHIGEQREVVESFLYRYARNGDGTYLPKLSPDDIPKVHEGFIHEGCALSEVPMYVVVLPAKEIDKRDYQRSSKSWLSYQRSAKAWLEYIETERGYIRLPKEVTSLIEKAKNTIFELSQAPEAKLNLSVGIHIVYVDMFAYCYQEYLAAYSGVTATSDTRMASMELFAMIAMFPNLSKKKRYRDQFKLSYPTVRLRRNN